MRTILKIPRTLQIVSSCWEKAEESLRDVVRKYHPGAHEEFVSQRFHEELSKTLERASQQRLIERAFHDDLKNAFQQCDHRQLSQIAEGLIADVTWHERTTERRTGGDLGLMIIRPQIRSDSFSLHVEDYRRGLLCQAKIKRANGKWGSFTTSQRSVLKDRLQYFALLLYRYNGDERRDLNPFQWQLAVSTARLSKVTRWLKLDNFPQLNDSRTIIHNLGNAGIGTDDDQVLDEVISPAGNPSMLLRITWPDGRRPDSRMRIAMGEVNRQQVRLYQRC